MKYKNRHLEDLVSFQTGKLNSNAAKPNGKYPFFTCSNETFRTDTWSFNGEYILLAGNNANGIYPLKYYCGKFDAYQRTYVIKANKHDELLTHYLYYALFLQLEKLRIISTGVSTKFLTLTLLKKIEIPVPPLQIQQKIVSVLSNYDNLTSNNFRRIEVLEEMAQLIYREWFVHYRFPGHKHVKMVDSDTEFGEIPEGWNVVGILDNPLFSFIRENSKPYQGGKQYYATADINGSNVVGEGISYKYEDKPSRAQKYPIIFSIWFARMQETYKIIPITTVNKNWADNSMISSGFAGFQSNEDLEFPYLYSLIASERFHSEKDRYCTGATQRSLTNNGLEAIKSLVPSKKVVKNFGEVILPTIDMILLLQKINKKLMNTRDFLLPKLISGEIDVSELEIETA